MNWIVIIGFIWDKNWINQILSEKPNLTKLFEIGWIQFSWIGFDPT